MSRDYTKEEIVQLIEEKDIGFIRLQFTDMFGNLKNVAITASQLEKALDNKIIFDGSSIDGFARIEESDMYLKPDISTMEIFPWRPQQDKVARMICDVYKMDGTPFEGDPRYILRQALKEAEDMGYTFKAGPECEFFLFQTDADGFPTTITHERAGYFDLGPIDLGKNARRDIVLNLEEMGFVVESSHHEVAPGQHEIDFERGEGMDIADDIMTFKLAVKTIAKRHGLHATFMPKPLHNTPGSGMHINMSLMKDGRNVFADEKDELGLSKEAYYFIGGLMKHAKGMSPITNPLINSYKRLVPGGEAPVYIAWSTKNRSPLIRIPSQRGEETSIELRNPDPTANPYLALAVCLRAGLDGIKNKIEPPKPVSGNVFNLSEEERTSLGIEALPGTLAEAIAEMETDEFIKDVLGKEIADKYIDAKKKEWNEYRLQVSEWEIERYLYRY